MGNFFEKLKKGMDIQNIEVEKDIHIEETDEEEREETKGNPETESENEEPEEESADEEKEPEEESNTENGEEKESESGVEPPLPGEELTPEELESRLTGGGDIEPKVQRAKIKSFPIDYVRETDEEEGEKEIEEKRGGSIAKKKAKILKEKKFHINPVVEKEKNKEDKVKIENDGWLKSEGQLVVDVYETGGDIVIRTAIAGIKTEDLDISIENDTVIIKGERKEMDEESGKNYFYQECYWGSFSREIILPAEVNAGRAEATMKNGILTIRIPKIEREMKKISVK